MTDLDWTIAIYFAVMAASVLIPALVFAFVIYRFGGKVAGRLCACIASSLVIITILVLSFKQVLSVYGFGDEPEWLLTLFRHALLMPLGVIEWFFNFTLPFFQASNSDVYPLPILLTLLFDLAFYSLPAVFFFLWRDKRERRGVSVQPTTQI